MPEQAMDVEYAVVVDSGPQFSPGDSFTADITTGDLRLFARAGSTRVLYDPAVLSVSVPPHPDIPARPPRPEIPEGATADEVSALISTWREDYAKAVDAVHQNFISSLSASVMVNPDLRTAGMAFTSNVPEPGEILVITYAAILGETEGADTLFSVKFDVLENAKLGETVIRAEPMHATEPSFSDDFKRVNLFRIPGESALDVLAPDTHILGGDTTGLKPGAARIIEVTGNKVTLQQ